MRTPLAQRGMSILEIMVVLSLIVVMTAAVIVPAIKKANRQKQATVFVTGVLHMSNAIRDGHANRETYVDVTTESIHEAGWVPAVLQSSTDPQFGNTPWGLRWWVRPSPDPVSHPETAGRDGFSITFGINNPALCVDVLSQLAASARQLRILTTSDKIVEFEPVPTTMDQAQINVRTACKSVNESVNVSYRTI